MIYETALRDEARQRIGEIVQPDGSTEFAEVIMVGIPSFNNAGTIGHVVRMAAEGMVKYFPDMKPVLVNSDGGSSDGTRQVVLDTPVPDGVEKMAVVYQGVPGKGSAFRAIFEIARALGAQVSVVVDSDLRSITPEWIELLAGPIVQGGYGYVTPYYSRHKYDGTITNNITYPTTRMLYGLDIRQPIGGDFGFSGQLLDHYLSQDVWQTDVARFGIDIWMTTTAINAGFQVCQAHLGAKIHDAKDPAAALGPMFRQVVGTLFRMMGQYEANWKEVMGSRPTGFYGEPKEVEPEPVSVTLTAMIDGLRAGAEEWGEVWKGVLSPDNLAALRTITVLDPTDYAFSAERWASIVFDFATAYNKKGRHRDLPLQPDTVIDAMTPLYYGRTAGLVVQSRDMTTAEAERLVIQTQARTFEQRKPELTARWEGASSGSV